MKFCLSALRFLMGCTKGKNGSFLAIRMKIHQKISSFMTPSWKKKGLEAMHKFLIVLCICGRPIFATITVLRGTHWVLCCIYKLKLNIFNLCSFFSHFKKFKCLGIFLDSVSLLKLAGTLRSQLLDVLII